MVCKSHIPVAYTARELLHYIRGVPPISSESIKKRDYRHLLLIPASHSPFMHRERRLTCLMKLDSQLLFQEGKVPFLEIFFSLCLILLPSLPIFVCTGFVQSCGNAEHRLTLPWVVLRFLLAPVPTRAQHCGELA